MTKVVKRQGLVWRVVAVGENGHGHGNCGHSHASKDEAVRCGWAPPGWDEIEVCDLLVRQVRDVVASGDRARTKRKRAA